MNEDLLERAARAVREKHTGHSVDPSETERLVLLRTRPSRRRPPFRFVLVPLVAALLGSAAWGASTGRLSSWIAKLSHDDGVRQPAASPSGAPASIAASSLAHVPPASATAVEDPETPPAPLPMAVSTGERGGAPSGSASVRAPALVPQSSASRLRVAAHESASRSLPGDPSTAGGGDVDVDALYRAAHRAQFERRDYEAALAAWDRYLDAAPNGSFSPEARFNRAVALFRLQRRAEAAAMLAPFARGDYGSYRRAEAQALLDALRK